jgi:hypothetical protein
VRFINREPAPAPSESAYTRGTASIVNEPGRRIFVFVLLLVVVFVHFEDEEDDAKDGCLIYAVANRAHF